MKFFRKVVKRLYKPVRMLKISREISRWSAQPNTALNYLCLALKETLYRDVTRQEKQWVDKIESLRKELNSLSTEITIVDYGAGLPNQNLSDGQMDSGRTVTRTIGEQCRIGSKSHLWGLLLFKLIRNFKPSVCLELGTCLGISGCYQAAGAKLNHGGRVITLEGAACLAELAQKNFQTLGLDNIDVVVGRFQDTLGKVLDEHGPIDYAFVDGHHDEKATLAYFQQISASLSKRAVLVFDDISWSDGMRRAWKTIEADKDVKISIDLKAVGICVVDSDIEEKQSFKIQLI